MRNRYLVIDKNYLRSKNLSHILATQPEVCLVLPDLAMLEMTKSDQRELTVRLSLETIARCPNRVYVAKAMGESLKYELTYGRSVSGHMISHEATYFIRKVLEAVAANVPNEQLTRVLDDPEGHVDDLKRAYLDHATNKSRALELLFVTKGSMSTEFAQRVRGAKATNDELLSFVAQKSPSLLVDVLEENGFSRQRAIVFARRKPMLLRYFYMNVWACLAWENMGRLESKSAVRVSNDFVDHQYVLAATFFDGVLSSDKYVNDAYSALVHLLSARV